MRSSEKAASIAPLRAQVSEAEGKESLLLAASFKKIKRREFLQRSFPFSTGGTRPSRLGESGMTLLELLITAAMIFILASAAAPLTKMSGRRSNELELRQDLREIREAIDQFKSDWDEKRISHTESGIANEETGYPRRLETLVKGVPTGDPKQNKIRRYLRRIPIDPITRSAEWGTRCYEDEPDSSVSCDRDVYDVYTRSEGTALDGTKYRTW